MAFKIELYRTGYRISAGGGRTAQARDISEVHRALDHFYDAAAHGSPYNDTCPFCRQIATAGA